MAVNPLSIPTAPTTNPLSIPGAAATPTKPVAKSAPVAKPFASTGLGIATNTILGIPRVALGLAQDAGLAPGGKTPFAETPVGLATNTVTDLPRSTTHTTLDIARGLTRDTLGLGRTIQNVVTGPDSAPESEAPPDYLKGLLGDQPIETIPTQFSKTKSAIENSPIAKKIGINKFASPIAFGAVLGNNILDFTPMGGSEDAAVKALAKETDVGSVLESLKSMGVHPEVAEKFAPHIAEAKSPKEVKTLLQSVKGVQMLKHTAEAREALNESDLSYEPTDEESMAQTAHTAAQTPVEGGIDEEALSEYNKTPPETVDESNTNIPDRLQPLAEAARSVGSPEEFRASIRDLQDKYLKGEPLTESDQAILDSLKGAKQDRIGTADEFYQRAVPKVDTDIPEELKPLAEEARKYKTADEFIDTQTKAYHRTPNGDFETYDLSKAGSRSGMNPEDVSIHLAENPKFAKSFSRGDNPLVKEFYLNVKNPLDAGASKNVNAATIKAAKEAGHDAIISDTGIGKEYTVFSPEQIKTEAQLRDIHTQATKERVESVAPEPRRESAIPNQNKIDPTIEEQFARRAASTPGSTIQALAKEPDAKSWQSLIKGFSRNLPKEEKAHLLDYMGTPEFVLEKLGLQKGAEMLQDAKDVYRTTLKEEIGKIIGWRDEVKETPDSARRIFKYLDGQAKDVRHEMTDTEYRVAQDIKSYLKDWAKRLNLPEDHQISNYITHIFEKGEISLDDKEGPFDDPDLAAIMEAQPAKSVYDPFLEKRVNKKGYKQDVWAALDAYVKRGSRVEAMTPALERVAAEAKRLDGDAYEYVAALTHNVNMRPTKIDGLIDNLITKFAGTKYTERPTAYLTNKFRNLFYRGSLGLNLSSALRNLSQGANTYAKLGERYTLTGYTKIMSHLATGNLAELYDHGILDESINQDRKIGVYKTLLQRLDPILYKMFDTAEKVNRGAAYFGAKSKAIDKGLSEEQAIKYAKRMVRETQFSFSAVDSAVALGGDAVKTALQLQNYNVKQIEFFARMLQNKEYAGLARWTISSLAFVYTIGRAFGMTPIQLVPSVGFGGGAGSPALNIVNGLANLGDSDTQKRAAAVTQLENTAIQAIPAGTQIKKTVQGLSAYAKGKDVTPTGKTRFDIPHDTQHLIQAALFGKSALPEAQTYYKKLDNPKSKKSENNPLSV